MTTSARERGWGNPDAPGFEAKNIITVSEGGIKVRVHRKVAPLIGGLIREIRRRNLAVLKGKVPDDWGYANRPNRNNPAVKSNHAWGLAVDLNSVKNPNTHDGKVHTEFPKNMGAIASVFGLMWGGNYSGRTKDPMHFEFLGTPEAADGTVNHLRVHGVIPPASKAKGY